MILANQPDHGIGVGYVVDEGFIENAPAASLQALIGKFAGVPRRQHRTGRAVRMPQKNRARVAVDCRLNRFALKRVRGQGIELNWKSWKTENGQCVCDLAEGGNGDKRSGGLQHLRDQIDQLSSAVAGYNIGPLNPEPSRESRLE